MRPSKEYSSLNGYKPKVPEKRVPKVLEKRVPVDPQIAAKVYACMNKPLGLKKLPSDFDRTLIKAHSKRNKKYRKTVC